MKLCFVIQKLSGLSGGAERVLVEVCNGLADRGMDITILTYETHNGAPAYPLRNVTLRNLFPTPRPSSSEGPRPKRLEALVKSIPNVWPLPQLKWAATYAPFISRLRNALKDLKPDVVIGFMPTGIMAAAEAAKSLGISSVASLHNVPEHDFGLKSPRWDTNPIYRKRRLEALEKVDQIFVLQDAFKVWFDDSMQNKISVVPNPIAPASMSLTEPRRPCIIGVGRLTSIKRYDVLISAFAKISAMHPHWTLEIYGDGPEKGALHEQIHQLNMADRIQLAGVSKDIMGEYARASIMCHPSAFEGFGLSVAEALAHGVPVVADAACSGVNSLIENGRNGTLVDANEAPIMAFANALDHLMANSLIREEMGRTAPSSVSSYAPEIVFDHWEKLLSTCQSGRDLV